MATSSSFLICFFLFIPTLLALSNSPHPYCDFSCETEVTLHLYLHQFVAGATHPNRNEEFVIASSFPNGFGTTLIHDWILTPTTNPSDTIVARVQGPHIQAGRTDANSWYVSQNIMFTSGRFTGSTLQVMGLSTVMNGQWSIVGGTGEFTMARGIISHQSNAASTSEDAIHELEIHIIYTANTPSLPRFGRKAPVSNLLDVVGI